MDENSYAIGSNFTLLQGFNNTMIDYEVSKKAFSSTTIEFPSSEQYQKTKKIIYLRNKTNYELEFSIKLNNNESKIYKKGNSKRVIEENMEKNEKNKNEKNNESEESEESEENNYVKEEEEEEEDSVFKLNRTNVPNTIKPFEIIPLNFVFELRYGII